MSQVRVLPPEPHDQEIRTYRPDPWDSDANMLQTAAARPPTPVAVTLDLISSSSYVTSHGGVTEIDLGRVNFALPGGIVAVACAARAARERGDEVRAKAPSSGDVARYTSRMGLGAVLVECGAGNPLPRVNRHDRGDVLVECQWADDIAIGGISELVNERLWDANVDAKTTDVITMAVYEVADNVQTHAASNGGFVCAQTYERGSARERIEVAVGDVGRGVRSSLQARHDPPSDEAALRLAIKESVSGLRVGRGLGLHYVARDIPRAGGHLTMRSGIAYLTAGAEGPVFRGCDPVVGTLVGIRVPVGRMRED